MNIVVIIASFKDNVNYFKENILHEPLLMVPGGSKLRLQGLSNNPYPDHNQPNSSY